MTDGVVHRRKRRDQSGFTLIELLVVIIILGILSAVVVFAVRGAGDKGSAAAAQTEVKTIRTAEESFCAKVGRFGTMDELAGNVAVNGQTYKFLSEVPTGHSVAPTSGGPCKSAGDESRSGFAVACADTQACSTMTVGAAGDGNILANTATARGSLGFSSPHTQIFETLMDLGSSYEVLPNLATAWAFVPAAARKDAAGNPMTSPYTDPTTNQPVDTWRFNIRTGISFHNGAPLDAAAVKAGLFDAVAATAGSGIAGGSIRAAANSAQVIDNTCTSPANCIVDFTPRVNNFRVPEQLVHPAMSVVAPGTVAGGTAPYQAVGTGPFKFVSYTIGSELKTTRNDAYWGTKALLKNMTFRFYPSNTTRRQALEAGDIDFAFDLPRPDIAGVRAKGFQLSTSAVGAYQGLFLNLNPAPAFDCRTTPQAECHDILADPAVRKAISLGIDRAALVNAPANFAGLATADQTLVPPAALAPYQSKVTGFGFDLTAARALLDNAGWQLPAGGTVRVCTAGTGKPCTTSGYSGRSLDLTLVSGFGSVAANEPLPDYLAGRLGPDLGINVVVYKNELDYTCTNPATGAGTGTADGYHGRICRGQGDIFIEQGSQNDANPSFLPLILFYNGPGQTPSNYQTRFNPGPTFFNLLTPVFTDPNISSVKSRTGDALHEAIDVQVAAVTLAGIQRIYSMKTSVTGFIAFPASIHVKWTTVAKVS